MSITIKDIAKKAGVSYSTVSKALNDKPGVNSTLKNRIKKIAKQSGYAPYIIFRETGMYNKKIKTIAVIYPQLSQHIMEQVQKGTDRIFIKTGYYELRYVVDINNFLNNKKKNDFLLKQLLTDKRISGIIFAFIPVPNNLIAQFNKQNIYSVLLNNYTNYGKCVTINNSDAMYQTVSELVKLGHKKIGLIMPDKKAEQVWEDRFNGYRKCLKHHKIDFNPDFIINELSFELKTCAKATKTLIQKHPEITAIIYGSDIQAYGGFKGIEEMKLKVPDDIAVVGFDDMELNHIIEPSLSSVEQPMEKMGELGAKMLIDAIKNNNSSHENIELEAKLHLRGSCIKDYEDTFWS